MPTVRDWDGNSTKMLILPDYTERHYYAAVRKRFREECEARGYEIRDSLRYSRGFQAWCGNQLVGEYSPNSGDAWVLK